MRSRVVAMLKLGNFRDWNGCQRPFQKSELIPTDTAKMNSSWRRESKLDKKLTLAPRQSVRSRQWPCDKAIVRMRNEEKCHSVTNINTFKTRKQVFHQDGWEHELFTTSFFKISKRCKNEAPKCMGLVLKVKCHVGLMRVGESSWHPRVPYLDG